jgi:acyl-CoA synthetase (AMP-forming)/AMP-acid ligase II
MNRFLAALLRNIATRPDDVFCHFVTGAETRAIRWGELGRRIGGFAASYRARRPTPGGIVPIFLRHDPALFASFFGAMVAGLVPAFLPCPSPRQDPAIYWSALRRLLAHLDPAAIVLDRDTLAEMRAAGIAVDERRALLVDEVPASGDVTVSATGEDAIALLQHSSGTTGLKKGVALRYRAIAAQLDSYGAALDLRRDDCIVSWLPLYHDMGLVACLLLPAYFGVPFVQLDPFRWVARPDSLFAAIAAHRGTLAWLPNFAFEHLANRVREPVDDLSSMRAFINCSEPCRPETFARFAARFAASGVRPRMLQSCYAMAETVFAVTQTPLGAAPRARDGLTNLGPPIAGIAVSIRDPDGRPLPDGAFGEIALRGECLLDSYYRAPALTAERLRDGWYYSRDRGCLVAGALYVAGRLDDLLIVNGRNVHAHEIEALVAALGLTRPGRAAAFSLYDQRIGAHGLIVVAERRGSPARDDAIAGRIVEEIRSTVDIQPRDVRLVPPGWVVKTTSGKIARGDNARKYRASFVAAEAALA